MGGGRVWGKKHHQRFCSAVVITVVMMINLIRYSSITVHPKIISRYMACCSV